MIVVADTSPLNYLVLIGEIEVLPALFGSVIVPYAVLEELLDSLSPKKVREWTRRKPEWLEVRATGRMTIEAIADLGAGESQAIQLALDSGIHRVLMDESKGRAVATQRGLQVQGTLGILERAAELGLVDFRLVLSKLELTNFRMSASVRADFLKRNR